MSIVTRTTEYLRSLGRLERGGSWLLAVSGGVDSMVMMHVFAELRPRWDLDLHAVYVDHGLRAEAAAEGELLREIAAEWKISSYVASVDVKEEQQRAGGSVQEAARRLRYDILERMRADTGCSYIATAHHADDQAETLIARFLKGAGPEGLAGIRPVNGAVVRPLLWASRSEIAAYAEEHAIRWAEDASNAERKYQRNIIRHDIIPAIRDGVNPSIQRTLARSAEMFRAFDEYHRSVSERLFGEAAVLSGTEVRLAVQRLKGYLEAEVLLVLRRAFEAAGCERAGYDHIRSVRDLIDAAAGAEVQLPGGMRAMRDRLDIVIAAAKAGVDDPVMVRLGEAVEALGLRFTAKRVDPGEVSFLRDTTVEYIDLDAAGDEWTLRRWKHGDAFRPIGFHGNVNVSDLLNDMKISPAAKPEVVVLERGGEILWVCGFRLSDSVKIQPETRNAARLTIGPLEPYEPEV